MEGWSWCVVGCRDPGTLHLFLEAQQHDAGRQRLARHVPFLTATMAGEAATAWLLPWAGAWKRSLLWKGPLGSKLPGRAGELEAGAAVTMGWAARNGAGSGAEATAEARA